MPCQVTIEVTEPFTAFTVDDGYIPYVDKNKQKLENLAVGTPSTFEISVPLDSNNEAMVFVRGADSKTKQWTFKYGIPDELDAGGKIYFPKIAATFQAASQSDLDKLAKDVQALNQTFQECIAGNKRSK